METRAENELYKSELVRLRRLLDSELNQKIQDVYKSSIVGKDTDHSDLEQKLRVMRKANTDQSKRIIGLNDKL